MGAIHLTSARRVVYRLRTTYKNHREIIGLWPSLAEFARDIGVPMNTAKQMRTRESISPDNWLVVVDAAQKRGFGEVTLEILALLRAKKFGSPVQAAISRVSRADISSPAV